MNTAFLLMTTAWVAGGDPGCAGCGPTVALAACDPCGSSPGLLSKLKGRFHGSPCDPCGSSPGLLAKLKARFHHNDCSPCGSTTSGYAAAPCATAAGYGPGGCALPPVPGSTMPVPMSESPKVMPKPMEEPKPLPTPMPKVEPNKVGVVIPSVALPVAPF